MLPISCWDARSYAPTGSRATTLSVVPRTYVSALPPPAAGVFSPPPALSSSSEPPQAAAPSASSAVQPNTAIRCARISSAPLQWARVRPPPRSNLLDGWPAVRRSCVGTATRQPRPASQGFLVDVETSERRVNADQAGELEPGMQRESVRAALKTGAGDGLDALQPVVQRRAVQEQRFGRQLGVAAIVEVGLERLHERLLGVQREQLRQAGM